MSLFGSLLGDVEDDPFFGSHVRHMRQMNSMMNSLFSDPFGMFGGDSPLSIMGAGHGNAMMPFMPTMAPLNRLFTADMSGGLGGGLGSSYSSSTVIMSSGPNGKPQVYSSSSSTKIGPNGVKETRNTLQDSRTGTKKMSIGHHIGERAHVVERAQNVYSGEREESQEFINIEEDEAEAFDREFQVKSGAYSGGRGMLTSGRRSPQLALPAPPPHSAPGPALSPNASHSSNESSSRASRVGTRVHKPAPRRPIRTTASPLAAPSASVREIYGGSHPQRHRHRHHKGPRHADN